MSSRLVNISEGAKLLGTGISTLRTWDKTGQFKAIRTKGGHRRYRIEDVEKMQGIINQNQIEDVAIYYRVSSHEQKKKGDLERQKLRVLEYCVSQGYKVEYSFGEVSSGMNDNRPKLLRLFALAESGKIGRIVIEHKDRLARFNFNIFNRFFQSHGVKLEWCKEILPKSYEAELVEDMLSLLSSFSSKIYGKRSAERRKQARENKKK